VFSSGDNELWYSYFGDIKILEGYIDANWISDVDELNVTSGYV
jgi:hypothetical protein